MLLEVIEMLGDMLIFHLADEKMTPLTYLFVQRRTGASSQLVLQNLALNLKLERLMSI